MFNKRYSAILKWVVVGLGVALSYQNCARQYGIVGSSSLENPIDPNDQGDSNDSQNCEGKPDCSPQINKASGTIQIDEGKDFTNKSDLSVSLTLTSQSASEMFITNDPECKVGGQWEPYQKSKTWTLKTANVRNQVFVKFRESPQDTNPACTSDSISHDDQNPVISPIKAAPKYTNKVNFEVELDAVDNFSGIDHLECFDSSGKSVGKCDLQIPLTKLPEGPGMFSVVAYDKAGNKSLPVVQSWTVDLTAPVVKINSAPSAMTNMTDAKIDFSGTDNISSNLKYQCQLDGAAFMDCMSPAKVQVKEGSHNFTIKALDEAGNVSLPVSAKWTVDLTVPTVQITSMPTSYSNVVEPSFTFTGQDGGVQITKFECKVDGGAYAPCTSPIKLSPLAEGPHQFSVVGLDGVGNKSAPATYTWTVDLTLPSIKILSGPNANSKDSAATFTFAATDNFGIAGTQCSMDGGAYGACTSPAIIRNLAEGSHAFSVRAIDKAGNTSAPASATWNVDMTAPVVKILSGPLALTKDPKATFTLSVSDTLSGVENIQCRLDGAPAANCNLTVEYAAVTEGLHTFYVKAQDKAGNTSAEVSYSWTVDVTGPNITFSKIPLKTIGQTDTATVEFSVTDTYAGVNDVSCGFKGSEVPCPVTKLESFFNQNTSVTYEYSVLATDKLGNKSSNSVSWTVEVNTMKETSLVEVRSYNKADILFVIDNSGSMAFEQQSMANRFTNFIDSLKDLDWQMGIVTTDLISDANLRDGRFVMFNTTAWPKIPSGSYILKSSMDTASVRGAFGATVQMAANGSGYEQGIGATYRAIQRFADTGNLAVNAPNRAFFRDGASLSVVVVTDANESPSAGTQPRNIPQNLLNLVKTTFPMKTFTFHSIIVKSGDSACLGVNGNESYGVSYEAMSSMTGGLVGSVCAPDYGSQLAAIGKVVVDSVRKVTLKCAPIDLNKDGKVDLTVKMADGSTPPSYTVTGSVLEFSQSLVVGSHTIEYTCLKQ